MKLTPLNYFTMYVGANAQQCYSQGSLRNFVIPLVVVGLMFGIMKVASMILDRSTK